MYATEQDIIDRYGYDAYIATFDRDNDGLVDDDAVVRALTDASDEIDTYLAARYELPLVIVPTVLKLLCVDIAGYKGSIGLAQTEEKRTRYLDAIKLLTKIAVGEIRLSVDASGGASFTGNTRLFTRDNLQGM